MNLIRKLDSWRLSFNRLLIRVVKLVAWLGLTRDSRAYWTRHKRESFWLRSGGEAYRKTDFDLLSPSSTVVDIGGFTGEFIAPIVCKYNCTCHVYEPIPDFYRLLKARFLKNDRVLTYEKGVGAEAGRRLIYNADAGSSFFSTADTQGAQKLDIDVVGVEDILSGHEEVDLLSLNCEGAEYEILNKIISLKLQGRIKCFFIQFHEVESSSLKKKTSLLKDLSKTHSIAFDFEWVWTRLDRKI